MISENFPRSGNAGVLLSAEAIARKTNCQIGAEPVAASGTLKQSCAAVIET